MVVWFIDGEEKNISSSLHLSLISWFSCQCWIKLCSSERNYPLYNLNWAGSCFYWRLLTHQQKLIRKGILKWRIRNLIKQRCLFLPPKSNHPPTGPQKSSGIGKTDRCLHAEAENWSCCGCWNGIEYYSRNWLDCRFLLY